MNVRLGKLPPRRDPRNLKLARYATLGAVLATPTTWDWTKAVTQPWGMLMNDQLGDCTCAALGHMEQCWEANTGDSLAVIADRCITDLYWATGSADNGRDMNAVLNAARDFGICGDKLIAFAEIDLMAAPAPQPSGCLTLGLHQATVNPTGRTLVEYATWEFGGAYIGLAMPTSAQNQSEIWSVVSGPGSEPGSWGGHAVSSVAYDRDYLTIVTWGSLRKMTWEFFDKYCDEAFAIISADWLTAQGAAPSGFDLVKLQSDLAEVTHG